MSNLSCPRTELGSECGPVWRPVLSPKLKMSIELHPCAVRHARPLLNGAIISFGNELDDEGGREGEDGAKAT